MFSGLFSTNVYRGIAKKELLEPTTAASTTVEQTGLNIDTSKIEDNALTKLDDKMKNTSLSQFRYKYDEADMTKLKTVLADISKKSETELGTLKDQITNKEIDVDATLTAGSVVLAGATAPTTAPTATDEKTVDKTSESSEVKRGDFIYPVPGVKINSPVGNRSLDGGKTWAIHKGVDIASAE